MVRPQGRDIQIDRFLVFTDWEDQFPCSVGYLQFEYMQLKADGLREMVQGWWDHEFTMCKGHFLAL